MTDNGNQLIADLQRRVQRLEDLEEIRRVMLSYTEAMDNGFEADRIASLFVEDATWDIQPASSVSGHHKGREEIRRFFAGLVKEYDWTMHNVGNSVIDLAADGLSAVATWYLVDPCTMLSHRGSGGPEAVFVVGRYRNRFVKVDGKWYFKELSAVTEHACSWTEGWVQDAAGLGG